MEQEHHRMLPLSLTPASLSAFLKNPDKIRIVIINSQAKTGRKGGLYPLFGYCLSKHIVFYRANNETLQNISQISLSLLLAYT